MQSYYTFMALQLAAERTREADRQRLAALARSARPQRSVRRSIAQAVATLSRTSAGLARRLDDETADELGASLGGDRLAITQ